MSEELEPRLTSLQRWAALVGAAALIACVIGAFFDAPIFFHAYLFAYLFWLGIALGSMGLLMMHHLTGGAWGFVIRRLLEAAAMTLPLLAVLFLPILFGLHDLFRWTHPDVMAADPVLQHKSHFFLNVPWFVGRAVLYFAVWIILAVTLRRWSLEQDRTGDPAITARFQHLCGLGLLLYVLMMSLAAIDWVMALEPTWFSTIFGLILICGQGLVAFAFVIPVAVLLAGWKHLTDRISPEAFRDLGGLMLAFVVLWTYMAFSQYLIIWSGNLADEATWYLPRREGGWPWIALFLILFHFFVPFVLLLFGHIKRNYRTLAIVALLLLLVHLVDAYWLVAPTFTRTGLHVTWMDILMPVALGGLWLAWFMQQVKGKALVPLHDPRLEGLFDAQEVLQHG